MRSTIVIDVAVAIGKLMVKWAAHAGDPDSIKEADYCECIKGDNSYYRLVLTDNHRVELSTIASDYLSKNVIAEYNMSIEMHLLIRELADAIIIYEEYLEEIKE